MLFTEHTMTNLKGFAIQELRLLVFPLPIEVLSHIAVACCGIGMLFTEHMLTNLKGFAIQGSAS